MSDEEDYVEEIRVVRRKKDTYRSNSSKSDEFESDLLRSKETRNVAGPTESRAVDEDELRQRYQGDPIYVTSGSSPRELTPGQKAVLDGVAELTDVVIREFFVPLLRDVAAPATKAKINEFVARRRSRALERAEAKAIASSAVPEAEPEEDASRSPDLEVRESPILVTRSDLLIAQLQLKLAEDFAAKQRWLIAHAEISDEDVPPALQQSVMRMIEGRAHELSERERQAVAVFLRGVGEPHSPSGLAGKEDL
ncbi:hypothetical protein JOE53_001242 [Microbacterium laevaniformans]|uniref:hypothetical protein n=1 Tax=Microbacterium laevaniformans TaxID=36807 RepID=UPI001957A4EA|nr:hypothetical protein [Microbacterium laevaniformans]MBM7752522.1 hypothetical protein [Microbacterium laevaniformans]